MDLSRYFQDKVVVITGSSRGIGRETARQALEAGALVVINGRDPAVLEETRLALGHPDRLTAVVADVALPEQASLLVARTIEAWGRLDVLINNAGLSMRGAFSELSDHTVRTMLEANFLSAVWATRAALPSLRQSRGRVVFISSLAGARGFPGVSLYSASKMALVALHQALGAEERPTGVSSSLFLLAYTENDIGKTVYSADGRTFRHERAWSMTQRSVAKAILSGVQRKRKTVVLSLGGKLFVALNQLVPSLVGTIIALAKGTLHSVDRRP